MADVTSAALPVVFPMAAAIEAFVRGFTLTRSFTHPYLGSRVADGLWRMHDAERRTGDYRGEEFVAWGLPPCEVAELAQAHARGRYAVCHMLDEGEPDTKIRAGYQAAGYSLSTSEGLFVHDLREIAPPASPVPVSRVTTQELADRVNRAARSRQVLPEHLKQDPSPVRQYVALDADVPVGWVRSVEAGGHRWCSNLHVRPAYRRRGIATALMRWMLADDRAGGASANVLLASHAGARLYPTLGYLRIGTLYLYIPGRASSDAPACR